MTDMKNIALTGDTLKNILIMAPLLDEAGQNKVYGLMCGLMAGNSNKRPEVRQHNGSRKAG